MAIVPSTNIAAVKIIVNFRMRLPSSVLLNAELMRNQRESGLVPWRIADAKRSPKIASAVSGFWGIAAILNCAIWRSCKAHVLGGQKLQYTIVV